MTDYAIVGPGALGLLWAARLAPRHGISLWGREGPQDALFNLITADAAPLRVMLEGRPAAQPDVALVTAKSHDALAAVQGAIARWQQPPHAIVLFQNGIQSQQEVAEAFSTTPVIAATTTEGANRRPNGDVAHGGSGITSLGRLNDGGANDDSGFWERRIESDFTAAGFSARRVPHIREALWQKLLVNAGINPFTVLLDCANGALEGNPFFERHIPELSRELAQASARQGYRMTAQAIENRIREVCRSTAGNLSSMLQDYRAGRRTEIDYINGSIVALGVEQGIDMPTNRMLWTAVKDMTEH